MKNVWVAIFGALLLSACESQQTRPGDTFDRINQELREAAESKRRASSSDAVGKAMMPPLQLEESAATAKPEPRFDLAVNNAPASQVFMALVSGTRYSMLFPPELSGNVTINLKGVTVREALESIREIYGYEYKIQGNRITIQPNALQSRIYQINYLVGRRQGASDMRITSSSPSAVSPGAATSGAGTTPATTQTGATSPTAGALPLSNADSSRVRTSSDNDFWRDLQGALKTIVGDGDGRNVILNSMSGVVLVKAMPAELRSVESYLKATQLMVERQVMLEAKILDVSLNESFQTGINWARFSGHDQRWAGGVVAPGTTLGGGTSPLVGSAVGIGTGTGIGAVPGKAGTLATQALGKGFFGLAFQSGDFSALLSFLETQGNVQVLSSPRIAALNNQKAVLKVGADDYFVTNISTSTTASGNSTVTTPTVTLQPFFSGIALDVTPQIDDDGNITLHVHPAVTVVEEKSKQVDLGSLGTFTLPLASSSINETDSIVRVQDGHIVAIGGLMSQRNSNDRNGLPGISRDPMFGWLFGQKSSGSTKRELVILMKATIIQNDNSWRQDVVDAQERVQTLNPRKVSGYQQ